MMKVEKWTAPLLIILLQTTYSTHGIYAFLQKVGSGSSTLLLGLHSYVRCQTRWQCEICGDVRDVTLNQVKKVHHSIVRQA